MASSFFIWCSGASEEILDKCPESEHIRQRNIGTFVFLTGIIAFCTSGYTVYSICSDPFASILGAIFWAALIFNLDRFLVSTTPLVKEGENYRLLKRYLIPRFLLAALIGIAIGTPFEMYLFKYDINKKIIKQEYEEEKNAKKDELDKSCSREKENVQKIEKRITDLSSYIDNTVLGTDKNGKIGCGKICKKFQQDKNKETEDKENAKRAVTDCEKNLTEKITNLSKTYEEEILKLNKNKEEKNTKNEITSKNYTLLQQYKALSSLSDINIKEGDPYIFWARWFFIGLFMFFEIAPLFAKFLAGVSNHDLFVYQEKERIKIELENDNHKDRVTDWLEMEKIRRDGEKEKLNKEWNTFHTLHQSFLDKFNQSLTDKYHEVFDEWMVRFDSEPHIDEMDEHFREKFKEDLARFTEFSTPTNSSVPNTNEHQPNDTEQPPNPESEENNKNLFESILDTIKNSGVEQLKEEIKERVKSVIKGTADVITDPKKIGAILTGLIAFFGS